jgi:hypothetical protein
LRPARTTPRGNGRSSPVSRSRSRPDGRACPRTGDDRNEIVFWRDVVPWQDGRAAVDVASDPEAWIARLASDPCLDVSEPERVTLGSWTDLRVDEPANLEALAVSVGIAAAPDYERAGCPDDGRVEILTDPIHWAGAFSIGGDELNEPGCPCSSVQRLYFASIGYVSHPHLLVVVLQSYGPNDTREAEMTSLRSSAQSILDSLIAPAIVVDN